MIEIMKPGDLIYYKRCVFSLSSIENVRTKSSFAWGYGIIGEYKKNKNFRRIMWFKSSEQKDRYLRRNYMSHVMFLESCRIISRAVQDK